MYWRWTPRFNPYYTNNIDEIEKADIILLPGSKNTLSDLQSLAGQWDSDGDYPGA